MNDRAEGLLDRYDLEVNRTWKGRGAILCDTKQGLKILKEYNCPREKVLMQDTLLTHIREAGGLCVEGIVRNKEGECLTIDQDQTAYILKDYYAGRECSVRDTDDCKKAIVSLARLHKVMYLPDYCEGAGLSPFSLAKEYQKHNKELKRAYKYLKQKSQKNNFEFYLLHNYMLFYDKAEQVLKEVEEEPEESVRSYLIKGSVCHGDYQYHNLLFMQEKTAVVNFEKCIVDSQMRDLCLFLRKLLEKNGWSESLARTLLETYDREKTLDASDRKQLYYRFAYPEKFWKIVNFYYNSGKAWIPEKNGEKFGKLLEQEENRERFLQTVFR